MKNIHIANSHRAYRKFIGHAVSLAALLAFVVNTMAVSFGIIVLALSVTVNNIWVQIPTVVIAGLIGALLAFLADGMTLSACGRLRISLEKIALIEEQYNQIPDEDKKDSVVKQEKRDLEPHERTANVSRTFIFFFTAVSACAGTLFWHKLMEPLPVAEAWVFSSLFSLLVSVTLISSELYKRSNNELVRESIVSDHFTNEALLEDANEIALASLHGKYKTQIQDIGNNTNTISLAIEEHAISVYDNLLGGGKGLIPARIQREKVDKEIAIEEEREQVRQQLLLIKGGKGVDPNSGPLSIAVAGETTKEKVADALQKYPNASSYQIASLIGVSQTTVRYHLKRMNGNGQETSEA